MGKKKRVKRRPASPDTRKTTVHIHRIKGVYHVTMNPIQGPDDKTPPEPVVYTLDKPEDASEGSELELDLTIPDPPYPPPPELKHQAQQFCEEDLPLVLPKPVFIKKKKKKKDRPPQTPDNGGKKKKPKSAKSDGKSSKATTQTDKASKQPPGKGVNEKGKEKPVAGKGGKPQPDKAGKGGKPEPDKGGKGGKPEPDKGGKGKANDKAGKAGKGKGKKKGDDDDDVRPWEEWIMKLKCKRRHTPED